MISIQHLSKSYGETLAVDDLNFDIRPGVVTGFLGPNGSGKSTTMRCILGLDRPTKGAATVNGATYQHLDNPLRVVGALLDAKAVHPKRSARNHLRSLAVANNIPLKRVDDVLEQTGIATVADKKAGEFSLGMSQRLGIAGAILGDPEIMMFDEPVNGLDPEGIRWIRDFFRGLAKEGRTVLVSSHLMSEMALTADEIVVIGRGKFITRGSVDELTATHRGSVLVRCASTDTFAATMRASGAVVNEINDNGLEVSGLDAAAIGQLALTQGVALTELTPQRASLEEVFMDLTADSVDYRGGRA